MRIFSVGLCLFCWVTLNYAEISPLSLTSLIKSKRTVEGRNLSSVDSTQFLNVTSYSGYINVDEKYDLNLFFWYFPVANANVSTTPLIIWLQGGPGATSLFATFMEIGPFDFNGTDFKLKSESTSWAKDHSLLFIDNSVGTGFSFTNDTKGYVTSLDTAAEHLHNFLQQFLRVFPELRQSPLFIAGESFAGQYVPAFAKKVYESKKSDGEERKINLQGLIMGNPVFNHEDTANFTEIFYQWGLIDQQGVLAVKDLQDSYIAAINSNNASAASDVFDLLLDRLLKLSELPQMYNVLQYYNMDTKNLVKLLNSAKFKENVHAKNLSIELFNDEVQKKLLPEFLVNMDSTMNLLLEHYRILIYCGQLDLRASCVQNAAARRRKWHWSNRSAFLGAQRKPLQDTPPIAGYFKSGGGLTEVLVSGAGHLVAIDKPRVAQYIVSYFIKGKELPAYAHQSYGFNDIPDLSININTNTSSNATSATTTIITRTNPANIFSWVLNGILITVIVICGYFYVKHKKRTHDYLLADDDSLNNEMLTLS